MHFFGSIGLAGVTAGGGALVYCGIRKLLFGFDIIQEHGPLMVLGSLLFLAGLIMFSLGLIGEVMIRIYFESQGRRIYAIRDVLTQKRRGVPDEARG